VAAKASVRLTATFEANLQAIEVWSLDREVPLAYAQVFDEVERVVDQLERHPRLGRRFLARAPQSVEVLDRVSRMSADFERIDIREFLAGDYLMLYGVDAASRPLTVYLLAIRHHRQLSFDFEGFWQSNRAP
jgi:plasmid stabilization system protein ParE